MRADQNKPVFIVGCARSGTTWLYHLLLSSGGFAIYRSESQLYSRFGPSFGGFKTELQIQQFLEIWLESEFFLRSGLDADQFQNSILPRIRSPGDMLRALMNGICKEQLAERWAECTPDHGLHIRQIKRDFPDALFIHLIRDGRDVALSLARQSFVKPYPWNADLPEVAAAAYWAWVTDKIKLEADLLGDDLLTVRYEDLVVDLDAALRSISVFIGKPIDKKRIDAEPIGAVVKPNSSFVQLGVNTGSAFIPRWQTELNSSLVPIIEETIGPRLKAFEYALSCEFPKGLRHSVAYARRKAYFLRFESFSRLKKFRALSRFVSHNLEPSTETQESSDPTLRPRENILAIRQLVKS